MSTTPSDDDDRTRVVLPQAAGPAANPVGSDPVGGDAPTVAVTAPGGGAVGPTGSGASGAATAGTGGAQSASSAGDSGNALPVGTYLSEFELTGVLGEGGFGIVYLAWDHSLQRKVALKEYMPASLASRENTTVRVRSARHKETFDAGLKSFINEARLLAQFDHPSLVKVYRFWEANGTAYMVMPLYEGTTLKDHVRAMPERPDEAWLLGLLAPLTEALAVIHGENCFHRDIAPDNVILLAGTQRPLLLDFGAARRVIGDMTQALTVILKPGYAPVEQYAESPDMKQGAWTDVYALAATVHWAITGRTPPPSVSRLMNDSFQPLAQTAAGRYSDHFLQAIDRALQVRPEQRTPSIAEFRRDLGFGDAPVAGARPAVTQFAAPSPGPSTGGTAAHDDRTVIAGPPSRPAPAAMRPEAPAAAAKSGAGLWVGIGAAVLLAGGIGAYVLLGSGSDPAPQAAAPSAPGTAAPAAPGAAPTAPATAPGPTAAAPATAAAPPPPPAPAPRPPFSVEAEFARVVAQQTPDFQVKAAPAKSKLRIDRDKLAFEVTSSRDGHVHVLLAGPDGSLTLLLPNEKVADARIKAGQTLQLPHPTWPLVATEPAGSEQFLVFVSTTPRSYADFLGEKEYLFLKLPTGAPASALAANWVPKTPLLLGAPSKDCQGPACDAYGATTFTVEVVR